MEARQRKSYSGPLEFSKAYETYTGSADLTQASLQTNCPRFCATKYAPRMFLWQIGIDLCLGRDSRVHDPRLLKSILVINILDASCTQAQQRREFQGMNKINHYFSFFNTLQITHTDMHTLSILSLHFNTLDRHFNGKTLFHMLNSQRNVKCTSW